MSLVAVRGPDQRGRWYWVARWWEIEAGERVRRNRSLGWHRASMVRGEVDAWTRTETPPAAADQDRNVEDLLLAWLAAQELRRDIAESTAGSYRTIVTRLVRKVGDLRLTGFRQEHVERYGHRRLAEGRATSTTLIDMQTVVTAWNWGVDRGLCAGRLARPRLTGRQVKRVVSRRTPTNEEVAQVYAALRARDQDRVPLYRLALLLIWCTGARRNEICLLRWCDVDLDRASVVLDGKTGRRSIPISGRAVEALRDHRQRATDHELVFGVLAPKLGSGVKYAAERLRLDHMTLHSLRRLAVDTLCRSGVPVEVAAEITGHSVKTMMKAYRQVTDDDKRRAMARAASARWSGCPRVRAPAADRGLSVVRTVALDSYQIDRFRPFSLSSAAP